MNNASPAPTLWDDQQRVYYYSAPVGLVSCSPLVDDMPSLKSTQCEASYTVPLRSGRNILVQVHRAVPYDGWDGISVTVTLQRASRHAEG